MVKQIEAIDIEVEGVKIPVSEIYKHLDSSAQRQYSTGQQLVMFGSIFGIVGFILCIAGIVAPAQKEQLEKNVLTPSTSPIVTKEEPKEVTEPNRRCPECGRVIQDDAKICPYCGKKFKNYFEKDEEIEGIKNEIKIDNAKNIVESKKFKDELFMDSVENEIIESAESKPIFCYLCGSNLWEDTKFCSMCGTNFKDKPNMKDKKYLNANKEKRFCYNCGIVLEDKTKFCVKCGVEL